jgi:Smg protein
MHCKSDSGHSSLHLGLDSRYIGSMFEVLVFVFENYWRGDACPELAHLERKLNTVGFEAEEIQDALVWLKDLNLAASGLQQPVASNRDEVGCTTEVHHQFFNQSPNTMRVYSAAEQLRLSVESLGFITFLESSDVLTPHMREIVIDRAMAASVDQVPLDDLKIIVLMVFWSLGKEPDALVLDELCESSAERVAH